MKKIISLAGLGSVALTMLFTSCVSKRKFLEAQASLDQCRTQTTEWSAKEATLNQNISSLEEKNKTLQRDYDNSRTMAANQQKKWDNFRTYYDQQKSTSEQIHQSLHQALDNTGLEEKNVYVSNQRVYVTLPEKTLFVSGSSKLNAKGKEILNKLSGALKDQKDIEIDITSNMSNPAYASTTWDKNNPSSSVDNPTSGSVTTDPEQEPKTAKTKKGTTYKKTGTVKNKNAGETGTYEFGTTMSKTGTDNWNLHVARATAIARVLNQNGIYNVSVNTSEGGQVYNPDAGKMDETNMSKSDYASQPKGFQIVIHPRMDNFYKYMDETGSTSKR